MSKLHFFLPLFLVLSFSGFSQWHSFYANVTNPTCNDANGGFTLIDQNGMPPDAFIKAFRMPDSVQIGNGPSYTGLRRGLYHVVLEFADDTVERSVFLNNFQPLAYDSMLFYSLSEGVVPDTCSRGVGKINWGDSPSISQEYRDTLAMVNWTWSNGQTGLHVTGLKANTEYWVKGSFGNGCRFFIPYNDYFSWYANAFWPLHDLRISEDTLFFKINNANSLNVGFVNPMKPYCATAGGSLTAVLYNSGTPPLAWQWSSGQTTPAITNIKSGNYTISVTDAAGCEGQNEFYLQSIQPQNFLATVTQVKPDSCNFGQGKLSASVSGGVPPYHYHWSTSHAADTFLVLNNVEAGYQSFNVTDALGCFTSTYINVPNQNPMTLTASVTQPNCAGELGSISLTVLGGVAPLSYHYSGYPEETAALFDSATLGYYNYTVSDANNCKVNGYSSLNLPVSCYRGLYLSMFRDDNGNCENNTELPIYNNSFTYKILNTTHFAYFYEPQYNFRVLPGVQTIKFSEKPFFNPSCLDANWNLNDLVINPAFAQNSKAVGFSATQPIEKNLEPKLYCIQPLRPGYESDLSLVLRNAGNQLTDTMHVTLVLPQDVSFINCTSTFTILDPHTIRIALEATNLGCYTYTRISVKTDASVPLSVELDFVVRLDTMNNETTLNDNQLKVKFRVYGSFDPNDISVNPSPVIAPNKTELEYRIRFQNLGTYYAQDVVIIDTLPEEVDMSTFKLLYSSHYATKIEMKGRVLTVRFLSINLSASITNEKLSHGEFRFSIHRYPNQVLGTRIRNAASIYFDFNAPVKTNISEVEVNEFVTDVQELISIYPNPSQDYFTVLGYDSKEVEVFDISGKRLAVLKSGKTGTFSISEIPSGVYFVRMQTATGVKTSKLLVSR